MIFLHTGQPGAGKTLYTIWAVRKLAEETGRPVFYSGIRDLKLPWTELANPEEWWKCPDGAIIVIDECQRIFRPRATGSAVPKFVSELETHRHHGFDLFLITQDPMLAEVNVRRLIGTHRHILRAFGSKFATIHEWNAVRLDPDKPGRREDSIKSNWPYPKDVFGLYHSAELHTHKRVIPKRLLFILIAPLVIAALAYGTYRWGLNKIEADPITGQKREASGPIVPAERPARAGTLTASEYIDAYTPRLPGLAHTAARYDDVTKPITAPVPAACVSSASRCKCYSQQGTRMDVPDELCRKLAEVGYFQDFELRSPWKDRPAEGYRPFIQGASATEQRPGQPAPAATVAAQVPPSPAQGVGLAPVAPSELQPGGAYRPGTFNPAPTLPRVP